MQTGLLAEEYCGLRIPLQVLKSAAGWYLGTFSLEDGPISRESQEYWPSEEEATFALKAGHWTQRLHP